ncbi:MAG: HAD hydrolase-like protein [Acidobacteriia bacterium]|nr:HAD hydrolase-like protein [Terriglobia bacterium]
MLDFDGVVLESAAVKGAAFRALFAEHPQHVDRIAQYHVDNGGLSRYEKFHWIYRELLRRPLTEDEMGVLDRRFEALIADAMRACPFVPGARAFIAARAASAPLFVASGAPERELRAIVRARGLHAFFSGVYGSPRNKTELLRAIAAEADVAPADMLFVGDGRQDWEAAQALGVPFVARVAPGDADRFGPGPLAVVQDLAELAARWPLPAPDPHR